MRLRVSSPGLDLSSEDVDKIERDLEKLDRRLRDYELVNVDVRVTNKESASAHHVVIEVDYGPNHVRAGADSTDWGQAVREAREDILRQINDRGRRGHSDIKKASEPR